MGISTLVAGYALWKALFYEGSTIYLLSRAEREAGKLLSKCRVTWEFLPNFLRLKLGKDQESSLTFPTMHSSIDALPSTEDAGRSTGATLVIADEWEYHPYDRQNFAAIKPTIDSTNGQLIGLTTTDATKSDTLFKELFEKARKGENNFHPIFLPYNVRPGHDEEWYKTVSRDLPSWQIKSEYPTTEEEALRIIDIINFFEYEPLQQMFDDCTLKPLEIRHNGMTKIWKPARVGAQYCSGIDISDGQYDWTAMPIMDWQTGEIVATFHAKIRADETAYFINELGREYNNALLAPEKNQPGHAVISKLKDLNYPNLYSMKEGQPGWWTAGISSAKTSIPTSRGSILHELRIALAKRQIVIYDPSVINELMDFIQEKDKVPCAKSGSHDDWAMALAITWQMNKYVKPKIEIKKPWAYKGI